MSIATQVRDLEADLAICEAATPGPWKYAPCGCSPTCDNADLSLISDEGWVSLDDARFITEAREGWPYAIRRALAAEAEIDRLRDEIRMLQEQLEQRCARA